MRHRFAAGFSVLELLVAIGISLPVLTILTLALRGETEVYGILRKKDAAQSVLLRSEELFQQTVLDTQSAPWTNSLRVHNRGRVTFFDGTPNSVMQASVTRQPLRAASAVTSAVIDVANTFAVTTARFQGAALSVTACPRLKSQVDPQLAHSLLGVSVDGVFELVADQPPFQLGGTCRKLKLRSTKSMLTATASRMDLQLVRLIVPIVRLRTLYLDRKHQLRYLAHRGAENIENQPILSGLRKMSLSASMVQPWKLLALQGQLSTMHDEDQEFSAIASFSHTAAYNFLLNKP